MTDHKFTDDEIIKAFERCNGFAPTDEVDCVLCPFCDYDAHKKCTEELARAIIDLINRQKAEIERLERIRAELSRTVESLTNESLTNKCADCAGCAQWVCDCSTIESEAIKEFVERAINLAVCKDNGDGTERMFVSTANLRKILKEMTEGGE